MKNDEDKMEALLWSLEMVSSENLISEENQSFDQLQKKLASYLDHLVATDFNKLVAILYRIDIPQEKAMAELSKNAEKETAGETLAQLIIERQLQKVITRRKYRKE